MNQKSDWSWQEINDHAVKEYQRGYYDGMSSAYISLKSYLEKELSMAESWYNDIINKEK